MRHKRALVAFPITFAKSFQILHDQRNPELKRIADRSTWLTLKSLALNDECGGR
jgi:hypothetical protein